MDASFVLKQTRDKTVFNYTKTKTEYFRPQAVITTCGALNQNVILKFHSYAEKQMFFDGRKALCVQPTIKTPQIYSETTFFSILDTEGLSTYQYRIYNNQTGAWGPYIDSGLSTTYTIQTASTRGYPFFAFSDTSGNEIQFLSYTGFVIRSLVYPNVTSAINYGDQYFVLAYQTGDTYTTLKYKPSTNTLDTTTLSNIIIEFLSFDTGVFFMLQNPTTSLYEFYTWIDTPKLFVTSYGYRSVFSSPTQCIFLTCDDLGNYDTLYRITENGTILSYSFTGSYGVSYTRINDSQIFLVLENNSLTTNELYSFSMSLSPVIQIDIPNEYNLQPYLSGKTAVTLATTGPATRLRNGYLYYSFGTQYQTIDYTEIDVFNIALNNDAIVVIESDLSGLHVRFINETSVRRVLLEDTLLLDLDYQWRLVSLDHSIYFECTDYLGTPAFYYIFDTQTFTVLANGTTSDGNLYSGFAWKGNTFTRTDSNNILSYFVNEAFTQTSIEVAELLDGCFGVKNNTTIFIVSEQDIYRECTVDLTGGLFVFPLNNLLFVLYLVNSSVKIIDTAGRFYIHTDVAGWENILFASTDTRVSGAFQDSSGAYKLITFNTETKKFEIELQEPSCSYYQLLTNSSYNIFN